MTTEVEVLDADLADYEVQDNRLLGLMRGVRNHIVYVAFVVLCAVFSMLSPYFLTVDNLRIILLQGATTGVVACGLTYLIIAGDIDLSVGSMYALGATVGAVLLEHHWNPALAIAAVLGVGLLLGATNGVLSVFAGLPSFLVTLGTLGVGSGLALILTQTRAVPIGSTSFNGLFAGTVVGIPMPVVWAALVALIAWLVLSRTVFGRYVMAVGGNRETSRLMGLPVSKVRFANFIICSVSAALAGLIIAARLQAGNPTIGNNFELDVITAVILGGTALFGGAGSIPGTLIGVLTITAMGDGLVLIGADTNVQVCAKGAILIATVLLRGKGRT
jgi:ribose transport system permease protein